MKLIETVRSLSWKNWLQNFLLTIFLFIVFIVYNNSDFDLEGEESLLARIDMGIETLAPRKYKPPYDFIFVNVGKDLALVKDENGGDNVITDREKLASFFKILADRNEHTYLLADILFDLPSEKDSLLLVELQRLKKTIFPAHLRDSGVLEIIFPVPASLADYNTNTQKFNKFRLIYRDTLKTIPVTIHEALQHVKYRSGFMGVFCNGKYCLQAIPPRYRIRLYQLQHSQDYPYFNLGDLLMLSGDSLFYNQFLKNKFVVLGNFETDIHYTPIGKMPGVLIMLNTYLSLLDGRQLPSLWWFISMFTIFFLINFYIFFGEVKVPQKIPGNKKWWQHFIHDQLHGLLAHFLSIAGLCLLITLFSEFVFHIKPHTFIIFLYIIIWQGIIKYYKIWKEQRE